MLSIQASFRGLINIDGVAHSLFFDLVTPVLITVKPVYITSLLPKPIGQPADWGLSIQ
jgi:hypothetical protein